MGNIRLNNPEQELRKSELSEDDQFLMEQGLTNDNGSLTQAGASATLTFLFRKNKTALATELRKAVSRYEKKVSSNRNFVPRATKD